LTDGEALCIHRVSLAILERTGVQVEEPETLRLFEDAGADVADNRVRLWPAATISTMRPGC
jgi:trimethylamine:corrinoid methyltransferase-like protein